MTTHLPSVLGWNVTNAAIVTFSFVVLIIDISLTTLLPVKESETGSKHERTFIDHREKGFTSEEDTLRSKRKQSRGKQTVKTECYLFTLLILVSGMYRFSQVRHEILHFLVDYVRQMSRRMSLFCAVTSA